MSYYHIYYNNETVGPYEMEQLRQMVGDGILKPDSLIFPEGATDWVPASQIEGLFGAPPPSVESSPINPVAEEISSEPASAETTESNPIPDTTEATEATSTAPKPPTLPPSQNPSPAPKSTGFSPIKKVSLGPKPTLGIPKGGLAKKMTNPPKTPTGKAPADGSVNVSPEQKAAFEAAMAKRDAEDNKTSVSKKKLVIIISIVVVTLTAIAGVAFFFLRQP